MRKPAQYGREVVHRLLVRFLIAMAALAGIPLLLLVAGAPGYVVAPLALVAIGLMLVYDRRTDRTLERRVRGNRGEERVGAVLNEIGGQGWQVMHDCATGRGNIDHVVAGPGGLFTVETKSRRGRVDVTRIDERWLKQAYAQKKLVERTVGRRAECLLVFSDAYLSVPKSRQRGVVVLPARLLADYLTRQRVVYSAPEVAEILEKLNAGLVH
jgi:hypothetical protein